MIKTLQRILGEYWLACLGGLGWMLFSVTFATDAADRSLARHLAALASGIFFFGFLAAQYQRISSRQRAEKDQLSTVTRLEGLAAHMEQSLAAMTGGDSFCWVDIVDLDASTADNLSAANIRANNGGRYPMHDVTASVRIGGHSLATDQASDTASAAMQPPQFFDFHNVPVGNYRQVSGHRLRLPSTPVLRVSLSVFARNGSTEQALTLRNVGRNWLRATQVMREGKRIHLHIDRGFPRRIDGTPEW